MKKRILAFVCMLAILVGVLAVAATANEASERYQVGYAKKDINPWVKSAHISYGVEDKYTSNISTIQIANPSNPSSNVSQKIVAVPLSGYSNSGSRGADALTDDNGDGIVGLGDGIYTTCTSVTDSHGTTVLYITLDTISGFSSLTGDVRTAIAAELGIPEQNIMVSGSHTHEGPDFDKLQREAAGTALRDYYDYAVSRIVEAALEAYGARSAAVMTKSEIRASEATSTFGYDLNYVRHYNVTYGSSKYVSGSNFGGRPTGTGVTAENVSEADDTMYLLEFAPENGDDPIVLVNWRAHATINGHPDQSNISSDYINALRYRMENNVEFGGTTNYRVCFFQGAAGNINPTHIQTTPWENANLKSALKLKNDTSGNRYGYLVGLLALEGLSKTRTELEPGRIRATQITYTAERQQDSPGLQAAAQAAVDAGFIYNYINNTAFAHRYTDGNTYLINSQFHANMVLDRKNSQTYTTYTKMELNSIHLGDGVAFVTAPTELFDRYSMSATLSDTSDNDWLDLVNDETYGTPFVLCYTNGHLGYTPNALAYDYNQGSTQYGVGSYEANTSRVAKGEGEKIIEKYQQMLNAASDYTSHYCQYCEKSVEWTPLTAVDAAASSLTQSHYYLAEDLPQTASVTKTVPEGKTLCLDLNGKTMTTNGRCFIVERSAVLNIMDSVGCGRAISYPNSTNPSGGVVSITARSTANPDNRGIFNLYAGTLQLIQGNTGYKVSKGGVVGCNGTFNMYGGTLIGDQLEPNSGISNGGCGGCVYVGGVGVFNMYNGSVQGGKAAQGGRGDCVFVEHSKSRVTLSGNASVDEIYFDLRGGDILTVDGVYTGSAALNFNPANTTPSVGTDIGNSKSANIDRAALSVVGYSKLGVTVDGTNLKLAEIVDAVASVQVGSGELRVATIQDAISKASEGAKIRLLKDIATPVTVNRTIYLDLNGFDITGEITVSNGCTLYGMDSMTDDYTINDEFGYGKLTNVTYEGTGKVAGVPVEAGCAEDGYLMITEADGSISFHRVNLQINFMTLRPMVNGEYAPSVYYKSNFAGDELVAGKVEKYGVALSVVEEPNAGNLETECKYSYFTGFQAGEGSNANDSTSTLLKGIMKPGNAKLVNSRNANLPVYGRAYILVDGNYMFGQPVDRTLKEQVELLDEFVWDGLDTTQKNAVLDMYETYSSIMGNWDLPNIRGWVPSSADGELKLLCVGNSYGVDSMYMLGEVYKAENPDVKVTLGIAYRSGCSLESHASYIESGEAQYQYYELVYDENNTEWTVTTDRYRTLEEILSYQDWELVVMQQNSGGSGLIGTYNEDIQTIQNHVKEELGYTPVFAWNMTWTYPETVIDGVLPGGDGDGNGVGSLDQYYNGDAAYMYQQIANAVQQRIETDRTFSYIIPTGTAIQNAKSSYLGSNDLNFYRDYTHLSKFGRFIAAYTWYCELERKTLDEIQLTTIPAEMFPNLQGRLEYKPEIVLTSTEVAIVTESVKNAMTDKYQVTNSVYDDSNA